MKITAIHLMNLDYATNEDLETDLSKLWALAEDKEAALDWLQQRHKGTAIKPIGIGRNGFDYYEVSFIFGETWTYGFSDVPVHQKGSDTK